MTALSQCFFAPVQATIHNDYIYYVLVNRYAIENVIKETKLQNL